MDNVIIINRDGQLWFREPHRHVIHNLSKANNIRVLNMLNGTFSVVAGNDLGNIVIQDRIETEAEAIKLFDGIVGLLDDGRKLVYNPDGLG